MLKWKRLLVSLMALSLVGMLAACGGGGKPGGANGETAGAGSASGAGGDGQIKLRMMWWGSQERHEATLAALELYTKTIRTLRLSRNIPGWTAIWTNCRHRRPPKRAGHHPAGPGLGSGLGRTQSIVTAGFGGRCEDRSEAAGRGTEGRNTVCHAAWFRCFRVDLRQSGAG